MDDNSKEGPIYGRQHPWTTPFVCEDSTNQVFRFSIKPTTYKSEIQKQRTRDQNRKINEGLKRLNEILPRSKADHTKRTKTAILRDACQYIKLLKDVLDKDDQTTKEVSQCMTVDNTKEDYESMLKICRTHHAQQIARDVKKLTKSINRNFLEERNIAKWDEELRRANAKQRWNNQQQK